MKSAPPWTIALALFTIYLVWGSTYLAIRVAVETLPPFLMAGARFIVAGVVLACVLVVARQFRANRSQWLQNGVAGIFMQLGGNGLVCWAEQEIPSGIATLIIAFNPMFFAIAEWLLHQCSDGKIGSLPNGTTIAGLLIGIVGLFLLVSPNEGNALNPWRVAALIIACLCWTIGASITRYGKHKCEPFSGAAIQMLIGGGVMLLTGFLVGEWNQWDIQKTSNASVLSWLYLVVAGSFIAYSAFAWLTQNASPVLVSTYAYINPAVAVFLGWAILNEEIYRQTLVSSIVIVIGVALISISKKKQTK